MSWLLFVEPNVKALNDQIVPECEFTPIFGYTERAMILHAAEDLSRETYIHVCEAFGDGPTCWPIWLDDNPEVREKLQRPAA